MKKDPVAFVILVEACLSAPTTLVSTTRSPRKTWLLLLIQVLRFRGYPTLALPAPWLGLFRPVVETH